MQIKDLAKNRVCGFLANVGATFRSPTGSVFLRALCVSALRAFLVFRVFLPPKKCIIMHFWPKFVRNMHHNALFGCIFWKAAYGQRPQGLESPWATRAKASLARVPRKLQCRLRQTPFPFRLVPTEGMIERLRDQIACRCRESSGGLLLQREVLADMDARKPSRQTRL